MFFEDKIEIIIIVVVAVVGVAPCPAVYFKFLKSNYFKSLKVKINHNIVNIKNHINAVLHVHTYDKIYYAYCFMILYVLSWAMRDL